MRVISYFSIIVSLACCHLSAARGGGSGGGSSGGSSSDSGSDDGGSGSSNSGGGGGYSGGGSSGGSSSGDGSDSGGDGSSGSGGSYVPYTPPCTSCACRQVSKRQQIYELPASYYNGTITVRHNVTMNPARDYAANASTGSGCPTRDSTAHTYYYPALFTIGSNLNTSDTNPVYWNLRGFPIPDKYGTTPNQIDVIFEWIHVRSADFVTAFSEYADVSSSFPSKTHTYWQTNVSSSGPSSWTANASYTDQPQVEQGNPSSSSVSSSSSYIKRSSNYITLSDVCDYRQQIDGTDGKPGPQSRIPQDNYEDVTIPTIYFNLGAKAGIEGIGSDSLRFVMSGDVTQQVVGVGSDYSCEGSNNIPYYQTLQPMQYFYASQAGQSLWNLSATVSLDFQGSLVHENSTNILANSTDLPVWDIQSKASKTSTGSGVRSTAKATSGVRATAIITKQAMSGVAAMLLCSIIH